jgi:Ca-activated chloride channel family protein
MTFIWAPLLLLVPVLLLAALMAWFAAGRRRKRGAGRLADRHLYGQIVRTLPPRTSNWSKGLQLAALAALLLAAARPLAEPPLPANEAAVVVALDTSRSMLAQDATPNRLEAARELAREFTEQTPGSALVGLASFSDSAYVLVPPTRIRGEVLEALERIEPGANTSLAAAIIAGVRMLPGREAASPPEPLGLPLSGGPDTEADRSVAAPDPQPPGVTADRELPPGRILVLSDGVSNTTSVPGLDPELALELALTFARAQEVEVFTLPVGRQGGTVSRIDDQDWYIPFDGDALESLATVTGGRHLDPGDPDELREVFRDLGRAIRWKPTEIEVSALLSALAAALLLAAGGLGLLGARRLP